MKIITMGNKGFSLVELMVAVGIIGSMSAVAVPNYAKFKAKSLQATAQQNLSNVYTLQNLYFTEHDQYGSKGDIGFTPNSGKYDYRVGTTNTPSTAIASVAYNIDIPNPPDASKDQIGFKATAKSDGKLAACANNNDNWCVNQAKYLSNKKSADALPCEDANGDVKDFSDGSCS